jgi:hypothetical protein
MSGETVSMEEFMTICKIFRVFPKTSEPDGGRIEHYLGCDGNEHYALLLRVWYEGEMVVYAEDLGIVPWGICTDDGEHPQTKGWFRVD